MATDIERARKARIRDDKRAERELRLNELSYSIEVTWPRSILGWTCGVLLMLTPPAFIVLAIRIVMGRKHPDLTGGSP
jgi:hypothetical protein